MRDGLKLEVKKMEKDKFGIAMLVSLVTMIMYFILRAMFVWIS